MGTPDRKYMKKYYCIDGYECEGHSQLRYCLLRINNSLFSTTDDWSNLNHASDAEW